MNVASLAKKELLALAPTHARMRLERVTPAVAGS
jgi:hypothetical protein